MNALRLALPLAAAALSAAAAPPPSKIAPALLEELAEAPGGEAEMLVLLVERADLDPARRVGGKEERGRRVHEALRRAAARSQRPLLDELARLGAPARPFWIANFVWTRGDERLARRLAARPEVAAIEPNARSVRPEPVHDQSDENEESEESELGPLGGDSPQAIEASLTQIGAPAVWALGFRGAGVVIGGQDTGVEWTHPALKAKYRGWNGAVADHDYHWHDAIHEGAGSCGVDTAAPCDDNDHGTHTIGTMLGDDGGSNKIGVAPGSRWIACKNMQEGVGTVATYSECFQWFVAPTDLAGENPDPARAPHVINNSWSCPPSEGCTMPNVLRTVVQNTRAAGIVVVVSAGNTGQSGCGTVETPAAIYDASFTVGAVDAADEITDFSSRGPVTVDGSNRLKPDLAAPGQSIRSAIRFGNYGQLSGTSMAGPHVAGAVALLLSADPFLLGDVDEIEEVLRETAFLPTGGDPLHQKQKDWCGGISPFLFPNHTFGAGRVDALAAVESRFAGGLIFRDNFELAGAGRWTDIQ